MRRFDGFDVLRVLAGVTVIYWHSYFLTGHSPPVLPLFHRADVTYGTLTVGVFFAMSGFLVTRSWIRKPDAAEFALSRVFRIFPGLLVCLVLTSLVLGPAFTTTPSYFSEYSVFSYVAHGVTFWHLKFSLPGVFSQLPYANIVNGSLWTLPYEFLFYIAILACGLLRFIRRPNIFAACISVAVVLIAVTDSTGLQLARYRQLLNYFQLDGRSTFIFGICFAVGTVCGIFCLQLVRARSYVFCASAAVVVIACLARQSGVAYIGIAVLGICLATLSSSKVRKFRSFGDPSFGIYIYAFPIQQLIAQAGVRSPGLMFLIAAPLALVMGYLSWHLVEDPALRLRSALQSKLATSK